MNRWIYLLTFWHDLSAVNRYIWFAYQRRWIPSFKYPNIQLLFLLLLLLLLLLFSLSLRGSSACSNKTTWITNHWSILWIHLSEWTFSFHQCFNISSQMLMNFFFNWLHFGSLRPFTRPTLKNRHESLDHIHLICNNSFNCFYWPSHS